MALFLGSPQNQIHILKLSSMLLRFNCLRVRLFLGPPMVQMGTLLRALEGSGFSVGGSGNLHWRVMTRVGNPGIGQYHFGVPRCKLVSKVSLRRFRQALTALLRTLSTSRRVIYFATQRDGQGPPCFLDTPYPVPPRRFYV